MFHPCEKYCLSWRAPGTTLLSRIPLDDIEQQEKIYHVILKMDKKQLAKLMFFFFPLQGNVSMFAPPVHPASLVSYRTKTELFNKLCEQYTQGKVTLEELNGILVNGIRVWMKVVYRNLPDDEREFHEYLNVPIQEAPKIDASNAGDKYLEGEIPFNVFHDLTFAERAKKRDLEALPYPRPYERAACVVCGDENGIIQCLQCENKICQQCILRLYGGVDSKADSNFLSLHRYHCMKRSRMSQFSVHVMHAPLYLTELRMTGRDHALTLLPPEEDSDDEEEVYQGSLDEESRNSDSDDEQAAQIVPTTEDDGADESTRQLRMAGKLNKLEAWLHKRIAKYEKLKAKVMKHQKKIDDKRHKREYIKREVAEKERYLARLPKYFTYQARAFQKASSMSTEERAFSKWKELVAELSRFQIDLEALQNMQSEALYAQRMQEYDDDVKYKQEMAIMTQFI